MLQVNLQEAVGNLPVLIQKALAGEEVTITDENSRIVKLVPLPVIPRYERKIGTAKGKIIMAPDFDEPLEDFKEYM